MMMFCEAKLSKQQSNTTTGEKYSSACSLLKTKTKVKEKTLRFDPNTKKEIGVVEKKRSKEDSHTRFSFIFHFGFGVSVVDTLNRKKRSTKRKSHQSSPPNKNALFFFFVFFVSKKLVSSSSSCDGLWRRPQQRCEF